MTAPTPIPPTELPPTIRGFLTAHAAHEVDAALRAFTPTAVVVDDGITYRGTEEVRRFLARAGGGYTYTTELTGAERVDATHWVARHRLVGDFPGGLVDLAYRFATDGDLVTGLVIAP